MALTGKTIGQLTYLQFPTNDTTHVYGDYNCTLFKNSIPSSRLSYYDGTDTLTIVNITS